MQGRHIRPPTFRHVLNFDRILRTLTQIPYRTTRPSRSAHHAEGNNCVFPTPLPCFAALFLLVGTCTMSCRADGPCSNGRGKGRREAKGGGAAATLRLFQSRRPSLWREPPSQPSRLAAERSSPRRRGSDQGLSPPPPVAFTCAVSTFYASAARRATGNVERMAEETLRQGSASVRRYDGTGPSFTRRRLRTNTRHDTVPNGAWCVIFVAPPSSSNPACASHPREARHQAVPPTDAFVKFRRACRIQLSLRDGASLAVGQKIAPFWAGALRRKPPLSLKALSRFVQVSSHFCANAASPVACRGSPLWQGGCPKEVIVMATGIGDSTFHVQWQPPPAYRGSLVESRVPDDVKGDLSGSALRQANRGQASP